MLRGETKSQCYLRAHQLTHSHPSHAHTHAHVHARPPSPCSAFSPRPHFLKGVLGVLCGAGCFPSRTVQWSSAQAPASCSPALGPSHEPAGAASPAVSGEVHMGPGSGQPTSQCLLGQVCPKAPQTSTRPLGQLLSNPHCTENETEAPRGLSNFPRSGSGGRKLRLSLLASPVPTSPRG